MAPSQRIPTWITRVVVLAMTVSFLGVLGCSAHAPVVQRDDAAITNDVRMRLAADPRTKPLDLTVETTDGVVNVGGSVPTDTDRNAVERVARDAPGVRSVDNDVTFGSSIGVR